MITRISCRGFGPVFKVTHGSFTDTRKNEQDAYDLLSFCHKNSIGYPKPFDLGVLHEED